MDFLKRVFKCKEYDPWRQFSREIGAEYLGRDKVVATGKNWAITFENCTVSCGQDDICTYTRVSAPHVSKDGFQFKIYRKGVFSKLCEVLGMQDAFNELGKYFGFEIVYMKVGHPEFERNFIIKSNNEFKVRALFANSLIRQLIHSQSGIHLQLDKYELYFSSNTIINDVARLKPLYELFKEILNSLSDIESTYKTEPPSVECDMGNGTADDAHPTSFYTIIPPLDLRAPRMPRNSLRGGADGAGLNPCLVSPTPSPKYPKACKPEPMHHLNRHPRG